MSKRRYLKAFLTATAMIIPLYLSTQLVNDYDTLNEAEIIERTKEELDICRTKLAPIEFHANHKNYNTCANKGNANYLEFTANIEGVDQTLVSDFGNKQIAGALYSEGLEIINSASATPSDFEPSALMYYLPLALPTGSTGPMQLIISRFPNNAVKQLWDYGESEIGSVPFLAFDWGGYYDLDDSLAEVQSQLPPGYGIGDLGGVMVPASTISELKAFEQAATLYDFITTEGIASVESSNNDGRNLSSETLATALNVCYRTLNQALPYTPCELPVIPPVTIKPPVERAISVVVCANLPVWRTKGVEISINGEALANVIVGVPGWLNVYRTSTMLNTYNVNEGSDHSSYQTAQDFQTLFDNYDDQPSKDGKLAQHAFVPNAFPGPLYREAFSGQAHLLSMVRTIGGIPTGQVPLGEDLTAEEQEDRNCKRRFRLQNEGLALVSAQNRANAYDHFRVYTSFNNFHYAYATESRSGDSIMDFGPWSTDSTYTEPLSNYHGGGLQACGITQSQIQGNANANHPNNEYPCKVYPGVSGMAMPGGFFPVGYVPTLPVPNAESPFAAKQWYIWSSTGDDFYGSPFSSYPDAISWDNSMFGTTYPHLDIPIGGLVPLGGSILCSVWTLNCENPDNSSFNTNVVPTSYKEQRTCMSAYMAIDATSNNSIKNFIAPKFYTNPFVRSATFFIYQDTFGNTAPRLFETLDSYDSINENFKQKQQASFNLAQTQFQASNHKHFDRGCNDVAFTFIGSRVEIADSAESTRHASNTFYQFVKNYGKSSWLYQDQDMPHYHNHLRGFAGHLLGGQSRMKFLLQPCCDVQDYIAAGFVPEHGDTASSTLSLAEAETEVAFLNLLADPLWGNPDETDVNHEAYAPTVPVGQILGRRLPNQTGIYYFINNSWTKLVWNSVDETYIPAGGVPVADDPNTLIDESLVSAESFSPGNGLVKYTWLMQPTQSDAQGRPLPPADFVWKTTLSSSSAGTMYDITDYHGNQQWMGMQARITNEAGTSNYYETPQEWQDMTCYSKGLDRDYINANISASEQISSGWVAPPIQYSKHNSYQGRWRVETDEVALSPDMWFWAKRHRNLGSGLTVYAPTVAALTRSSCKWYETLAVHQAKFMDIPVVNGHALLGIDKDCGEYAFLCTGKGTAFSTTLLQGGTHESGAMIAALGWFQTPSSMLSWGTYAPTNDEEDFGYLTWKSEVLDWMTYERLSKCGNCNSSENELSNTYK